MKKFYKNPWQVSRGLQKVGITVLTLFGAVQGLNAQVSSYSFTQSSGAFTSIASTGTLIAGSDASTATTNDTAGWSATIPFNFNFNGTDYTSVYVNSNGGATFGTPTSTSSSVISASTAYAGAVGVMNKDLWGVFVTSGVTTSGSNIITNVVSMKGIEVGKILNNVNGIPSGTTVTAFDETAGTITMSNPASSSSTAAVVRYGSGKIFTSTVGTAPNRVFVVEWIGYNDYGSTVGLSNHLNFQLRLSESTNIISTVYGPHYSVNSTSVTNQIGLRGATTSDYNNRTSTTSWSATTAGTSNSATVSRSSTIFPAVGQTFNWAPPIACTGTPLAGTIAPTSQMLAVGQIPAQLVLTGYSAGVSGLNFQWQESADNITFTNVSAGTGATTSSYTPVAFAGSNIYYKCIVTCTASGLSATSPSVMLSPCSQVSDFSQNFDALTTPALPTCWTKVGTTGTVNTQAGTFASSPNVLYVYSSSATAIAMVAMQPLSTLQSGAYRLKFKARSNLTVGGIIQVGYLTNPADQATFTSLGSFTTTSTTAVDNFVLNNVTAPTGVTTLAFRHTGSPANSVLIDDVVYELMSSCADPTAVTASGITSSGATVTWVAPAAVPTLGYDVYYSSTSTAPTTTSTPQYVGVTATSQNIPGTAGTVFYVWVRSRCSATSQSSWVGPVTYTIPSPPPANDNCSGAIALTPGATFAQNAITATTVAATLTTDATATTACQATRYADTWYSVVVPASGNITIETKSVTGSSVTDTVLGVYSGTCGALVSKGCDDDSSTDGNFSMLSLTSANGITAGQTLLIGVWNYSSSNNGTFQVSAYDASLSTSEISQAKNNIKVYPNPFADVLNISDVANVKSVSVVDIAGRLVKTIDKPNSSLQLGDLKSGMYIVILNMNDGSKQTMKAIKK